MQSKKEHRSKHPKEEEEDLEEVNDEDEEEEEEPKPKKKTKKNKKKKVQKEEEEDEDNQDDEDDNYNIKKSLHPLASLFTFVFKAGAAIMYLFGTTVFQDKLVFISVVLLCSFDFWTVKNISGRLLVGLRWWSDYDEEGNEIWKFESPGKKFQANIVDKSFFWTSQLSITIFWAVFLVLNIISISVYWGILDFVGFSLASTNLFGYYKCSKEHQDKLKNMRNGLIKDQLVNFITRK